MLSISLDSGDETLAVLLYEKIMHTYTKNCTGSGIIAFIDL